MNLISNKSGGSSTGTLTVEGKGTKLSVKVDAKSSDKIANGKLTFSLKSAAGDIDLKDVTVDFAATIEGDGYAKINNLKQTADAATDALIETQAKQYEAFGVKLTPAQIKDQKQKAKAQIAPAIAKIDNKWVKFSPSKPDSETSKQQKCATNVLRKLQDDNATRSELTNVYMSNKFIVVKEQLPVKDGNLGYVLDFDKEKSKSFGKAVEQTNFIKELEKCNQTSAAPKDSTETPSADEKDTLKDTRFELWVDQWSHRISAVKFVTKFADDPTGSMSVDATIDYKAVEGLTLPKDAVDSEVIFKELMMAGAQSSGSLTAPATPAPTGFSI